MTVSKVAIASDHGGIELRKSIISYLESVGISYEEFGPEAPESVDYPGLAITVSEKVVNQEVDRGILVCGTGIGMSIAANKVKGIRCALVGDTFSAHATREHNDTNVLALGARVIGPGLAEDIVKIWLETAYEGGRHANRVGQITAYEDSHA
ncbi:TPA: ribose 5-phosphate isomerase B [Listeria monocytogenes]|uniref:Ribose 5-phosphate isomerase B n=2 Tax=Listeria monocytogenes TaxID=1639 RepID=A0A3A2SEB7_LISMN|nr:MULTISPECIES: ribose 5-phosphate isomerase B [Listeria]EAA0165098.1 ribose 5-phosphate isomerase B [Listeria monocytogenes serotype 1/2a]EAD3235996.1 ribose 5-phosphate isomerase B [Listeria monocytogenes CFSAN002202]EAE3726083.1 ribose 5-phosphate isomerase B [Listeria monocytogenes serotype 1/2b]EAF4504405.1 ribose 5-phosphate isomerase B [Listeria monocytogenes serotype 4b]EAG6290207.1 ribose 5-phosphate isomerase B [Listeria monocytogenes CFSAN003825]EAG6317461.1 ribose 5-phosphate iso